jgi:hypothetical protein
MLPTLIGTRYAEIQAGTVFIRIDYPCSRWLNKTKTMTKTKQNSTAGPACLSHLFVSSLEHPLSFQLHKSIFRLSCEDPTAITLWYV